MIDGPEPLVLLAVEGWDKFYTCDQSTNRFSFIWAQQYTPTCPQFQRNLHRKKISLPFDHSQLQRTPELSNEIDPYHSSFRKYLSAQQWRCRMVLLHLRTHLTINSTNSLRLAFASVYASFPSFSILSSYGTGSARREVRVGFTISIGKLEALRLTIVSVNT